MDKTELNLLDLLLIKLDTQCSETLKTAVGTDDEWLIYDTVKDQLKQIREVRYLIQQKRLNPFEA